MAGTNQQKGFRNWRWESTRMTSFPSCKTEVVLGRLGGLVTLESTKKNFAYVIVQGEPLVSVLLSYCCNNATQQTPTPPNS